MFGYFPPYPKGKRERLAYTGVSGSKSVAGKQTDCFGTWENLASFPNVVFRA